jgi:hypothetical protein
MNMMRSCSFCIPKRLILLHLLLKTTTGPSMSMPNMPGLAHGDEQPINTLKGLSTRKRRPHEERLLSEAGKRFWSRRNAGGGPELSFLPDFFTTPNNTRNSRRRNLAFRELSKTGHDYFQMNGNSPVDNFGIGSNDESNQNRQPSLQENPRNHKDTKKSTKGESGGKGGMPSRPVRPPVFAPPKPLPKQPTRPPSVRPPSGNGGGANGGSGGGDGVCRSPISMQFLQFSAIPPAILVFPQDPNDQDMGTRYIYNTDLRDVETLDELVGSRCNGVCTRTQARIEDASDVVFQLGGGHCTFTYTMFDGNREFTIEASGTIVDSLGGTLSIVGGTKDAIGAFGEITLVRGWKMGRS